MKKKILLVSTLIFAVCSAFTVMHYGNINIAEAAKENQNDIVLFTAPFTLNAEDTIRVLLRNPLAEATLQYEATIFDLITGDEIATQIFSTQPGHGISRIVEVPSFLNFRSIFIRITIVTEGPVENSMTKAELIDNIIHYVGLERMNVGSGDYTVIKTIIGDLWGDTSEQ